jgi:hypothetical protein
MPASATKKTTVHKKQVKKAPVKRAAAKQVSKTTVRTKKAVAPEMRSFRAARTSEPFFTFRITHQTFYWLILAVIVVGLAAWVTSISIKVQHIYDQIDATNQSIYAAPVNTSHKAKQ